MSNYREIISKSVISKGKKNFLKEGSILVSNKPKTVLGCWVINHQFNGVKQDNQVIINGSYDINIWYSYDNDTKTDVVKKTEKYTETVKMKDIKDEYDNTNIIVRSLNDPKCSDVKIKDNNINYQVEFTLGLELIGDVKVKVEVLDNLDEYDLIDEEKKLDEINDINDINENYLEK